MRLRRRRPLGVVGVSVVLAALACGEIEGTPRTLAPLNVCPANPCETYAEIAPGRGKPKCNGGRCEYALPDLGYTLSFVVHVPTNSQEVAGLTFIVPWETFTSRTSTDPCAPPSCLPFVAGEKRGRYRMTAEAVAQTGLPVADPTVSVPVRVAWVPVTDARGEIEASDVGLPLDTVFTSSAILSPRSGAPPEVLYSQPLAPGRYLRYVYPQPPFDAYLPPAIDVVTADVFTREEDIVLGQTTPVDDPGGTSRTALVRRAEGLDGWRLWLADATTGQRISTLRTLEGTESEVRLQTTGQSASPQTTALREGVDVVVAPPEDWVAVPRLVSTLIGGTGLRPVNYPALPPPTRVTGLVSARLEGVDETPAVAVPGRVSFRSAELLQQSGGTSQLLRYETSVATDATGLFATVLPPGRYSVTVEPDPLTDRGKVTTEVEIEATSQDFALNLSAPLKTTTRGRAILADGRPLADADVIATAAPDLTTPRRLRPRPARTRTGPDGSFSLALEQGAHQLAVVPQDGSGFPRVVVLTAVGGSDPKGVDLADIEIPAPVNVAFALKNPRGFVPIPRATVRAFTQLSRGGWVEVGRAISNQGGQVEMLLARQPR